MNNKQAFIKSVENAGIKMQSYIDSQDHKFFDEAVMYIRAAHTLLSQLDEENTDG